MRDSPMLRLAALFACGLLLAAATIKSGATTDVLTIDAVSKAARVTIYDPRGNLIGQRATYSSGTTNITATTAGTGIFYALCGSASKTIRVQRVYVGGRVATAAIVGTVVLTKTSTATSSGTPSVLAIVPRDSASGAATATSTYYTAVATTGTVVGVVGTRSGVFPILATAAATDQQPSWLWDFRDVDESESVVLRGTAQCLQANFGATTTNAPSLAVYAVWTEE